MIPFEIRQPRLDDAEAMVAATRAVAEEPGSMLLSSPGEFRTTVEMQQQRLIQAAESGNSLYLVAESEGELVGVLHLVGGKRLAVRHVARLAMNVASHCRDQGIGSALLDDAIGWARSSSVLTRIELNVFAHNARAIHLYQKFGFEIEGLRRNAYFRDDRYCDGLLMALLLRT